jgi:hypothetical protein
MTIHRNSALFLIIISSEMNLKLHLLIVNFALKSAG